MAELGADDVDDSGRAGGRLGAHASAALPKGNILDELKKESG